MHATVRKPATAGTDRYATVAILLHWLIAAAIVLQVVLANRMEGPKGPTQFAVTQLHKSVGITILVLTLARLGWRLANPPPPLPATMSEWERRLARLAHVGLYGLMLAIPLTGWIMVSASTRPIPLVLFGVAPFPDVPGMGGLAPAARHLWHEVGETGHGLLVKLLYVLVGLHVAGALKHQLFSRDEPVLARMAPGAVAGRWLDARIFIILAAFVAVIVAGKLLTPPPPGVQPPPAATARAAGAGPAALISKATTAPSAE